MTSMSMMGQHTNLIMILFGKMAAKVRNYQDLCFAFCYFYPVAYSFLFCADDDGYLHADEVQGDAADGVQSDGAADGVQGDGAATNGVNLHW